MNPLSKCYGNKDRNRWQQFHFIVLLLSSQSLWEGSEALRLKNSRVTLFEEEQEQQNVKSKSSWVPDQTSVVTEEGSSSMRSSTFTQIFHDKFNAALDALIAEIHPLRDAWDGLISAYHLAWTGYYHGFVGLFYEYPWEGFSRNGVLGLFAGTAAGIVHFASMTTSGVAAGLYQAVRGIERTFEALQATREGKVWHDIKKEWFFYSLDNESATVEAPAKPEPTRKLRRRVMDNYYYELLDIQLDATTSEIRKAYYRQALTIHPDKTSEEEATDRFRTLNKAYKTLVTKDSRELYDSHGICFEEHGLSETTARVDPYTFFSILFRTGVVEPYVGDLAIASMVDKYVKYCIQVSVLPHDEVRLTHSASALQLTDRAESISIGDSNYASPQQLRRQINIASHLRSRISLFTNGDMTLDEFQLTCREEAQSLSSAMENKFQAQFLLKSIARGLVSATAEELVPSWATPFISRFTMTLMSSMENMKVTKDLEREIIKAIKATSANNENSPGECNTSRTGSSDLDGLLLHLAVPRMLKLVWKFNANDVTRTLREACKRVLDDSAGDRQLRMKRAKALNILGREFYSVVRTRQSHYGRGQRGDPSQEEIQVSVKGALLDAIVREAADD